MNVILQPVRQLSPKELKRKLENGEQLTLIDVREQDEREIASLGGDLIPMSTVLDNLGRIPREGTVVVYCRSGGRSGKVVEALQQQCGYTNLWNLDGGILRWSDDVDSSVQKY
jgi:rhodanese-related sulfurtransferase